MDAGGRGCGFARRCGRYSMTLAFRAHTTETFAGSTLAFDKTLNKKIAPSQWTPLPCNTCNKRYKLSSYFEAHCQESRGVGVGA